MLWELVRDGAARAPGTDAVRAAGRATTYAALAERAGAVAAGLAARGIERFGLLVADPATAVAVLAGAAAVGAEPCSYAAASDDDAVRSLAARFDHRVVVTDRDLGPLGLHPDELAAPGPVPAGTGAAPVLVLTTGTTGEPKGARHDWGRLAAAVRRRDEEPGTRWLLAYNLNQFAGTQVLLHALVHAATLVVPASNQPRHAVEAIRAEGVTHVSATPTFWRFLVAALEPGEAAELPVRQITLGGEAVPGPLLEDLHRLFPEAKVSQVYASTELGSTGSVRDGRNGLPVSVLDGVHGGVELRIVDGELHARSSVGMLGYHGEPDVDDGWRPTGDLVEVRDGRIHFAGRSSTVINVGGVKVHPLPVEERVLAVPGVTLARVYGRSNPMSGQIVAVDVVLADGADEEEVEDAVRDACDDLPAAARPRRIRFVDDIEVREGKVSRR